MKLLRLLPFVVLLLSSACHASPRSSAPGSRASSPASATAAAGTSLPQGVASKLGRYAFSVADLPDGFRAGGVVEVPNDVAAQSYADPPKAIQEIQQTGRQGGLGQQVFSPPGQPGDIGVTVEIFPNASGAARWAAEPPDLPPDLSPQPAQMSEPPGEHASATHWQQGRTGGYVLSFNRGAIVLGVGISAPLGQESLEVALDLARRLDKKAQQIPS
jgi:hypothetical protein